MTGLPRHSRPRAHSSWRSLLGGAAALALVGTLTAGVDVASAGPAVTLTTLTTDSFTNATTASTGWTVVSGGAINACLTAGTDTTQTPIAACSSTALDSPGSGALRLTTNGFSQVGTVYNTTSIPTSQGVDVRFNTFQYKGTTIPGADGIAFILAATDPTNPAPPAGTGPLGGSLGYSATSSTSGVTNGYLGFGLDVFGNYRNSSFGGSGCSYSTARAQNVTVRGPGNNTSGYCILGTTVVSSGALDSRTSATRSTAVPVEIALNPNAAASTTATGLTVPARSWLITFTPVGGSQQTLTGALPTASTLAGYGFPASWYDASTGLPYQLTFGWAASTGGNNEIHEISTLASTTLNGQLPAFQLAVADDQSGRLLAGGQAVVTVTPSLDPNQGSESQPATVTTTFPAGLTPANPTTGDYACTTSGQVVSCTYTPAGTIAAGTSLPALNIPVTVAGTASGARTITAKVSSRDANPQAVTDTVTVVAFGATATPGSTGYGNPVTLAGTNLPATATGTITFTSGGTTLCTATLPATTCATAPTLAPGTYPTTASYSGDGADAPATATTSFTIGLGATAISAGRSDAAVPYGTSDTLSFSGLPADATGSVTFTSGGTTLCTVPDVTVATSCLSPDTAGVGTYPVTATYSGDDHYTGSAATTSYVVAKADSAAFAAAVASPTVPFGTPDTVSFTGLAPGATGSVTFTNGAATLCTVDDVTTTTSCSTPDGLIVGNYPVTATYSGDENHNGATATTSYAVVQQDTAITAAPSDPVIPFGTSTTLTVGNLPAGATGSVTFTSGGKTLCTIEDITATTSCSTPVSLAAATYPVKATYSGDGNFAGSNADTSFTVSKSTPAQFTANVGAASIAYGTPEPLVFSGLPADATGSVTFTSGSTVLCTVEDITKASGCTAQDKLGPAAYPVVATYSGDANYTERTADTGFTVVRADTAVSAAVGSASVSYGTDETLSFGGLPTGATGKVTFTTTGGTVLCTVDDITTASSCVVPGGKAVGTYPVTATYSGDGNFTGSTDSTTFAVTKAATALSAAVSDDSVPFGTPTTLSFSGLPTGATGSVTFTSGSAVLCTVADITMASSCPSPVGEPVGTHAVLATYSGDGNHGESSATTSYAVTKAPTAITAQPGQASIVHGTGQTLFVSGLPAGATGSATFTSGTTVLCTVADVSTATSCPVPAADLPAGTYPVTATYSGDAAYAGSNASTSFVVTKAPTALQATVAQANIGYGEGDTLSVSGLPDDATGTVTFVSGADVLCTATLPTRSCPVAPGLPGGDYPVAAVYSGDANYQGAQSDTGFVVAKAPITLTAAADPAQTTYPGRVTLSASGLTAVTGAQAPTGTVTFVSAAAQILCTATLPDTSCQTAAGLGVGDYQVTATYSGDTNYVGATAATSFTVTMADVSLTAGVSDATVAFGTADRLSVAGLAADATGTVTFSADGRTLCTATLPATSCPTPTDLPVGSYAVTATYSGDANHHGATAETSFTVARAAAAITATGPGTVAQGANGRFSVTTPPGATGTVTISAGATVLCSFTLPETSCTPTVDLAPGTYEITAAYSGDANFAPATQVLGITITAAPTITSPTITSPTGTSTDTTTATAVTTVTTTGGGGTLPDTGVDAAGQVRWGLFLLAAGGAVLLLAGRRRPVARHR